MLNKIVISLIKIANIRKNPKAKISIIQTPTSTAFNPSKAIAESIESEGKIPKTENANVAIPKPTYQSISIDKMRSASKSFNSPLAKIININKPKR